MAMLQCEDFARFASSEEEADFVLQRATQLESTKIRLIDAASGRPTTISIGQASRGKDCVVHLAADENEVSDSPEGSDSSAQALQEEDPPLLLVVDRLVSVPLPPSEPLYTDDVTFVVGRLLYCLNPESACWRQDDDPADRLPHRLTVRQDLLKSCVPGELKNMFQLWWCGSDPARYVAVTLDCVTGLDPCFPIAGTADEVKHSISRHHQRQTLLSTPRVRLPFLCPGSWIRSNKELRNQPLYDEVAVREMRSRDGARDDGNDPGSENGIGMDVRNRLRFMYDGIAKFEN